MKSAIKDMYDQSLAILVDVQPLSAALLAFWSEILNNQNARPYHLYKGYAGYHYVTLPSETNEIVITSTKNEELID